MENIIEIKNEQHDITKYVNNFLEYIDVSEKTVETYKIALKQFCKYLYQNNINMPTREEIIEYREHLKTYLKPTTVNSYLVAIKNLYSWLEYEGITKDITKNIKGIKLEHIHLKRGLSEEEIKSVLNVCKDVREELLIKLMISCGLRTNEVVNIQLKDFYKENNVVLLKVLGKARDGIKQDSVKIDDRLVDLIKKYIEEYNITDYLFTSTSNNNNNGKLTTKTIRYIVTNLFKKANLDMSRLSTHGLRHTTCELALESGTPIQEVSQFMRHKNISTTLVYAKEMEIKKSQIANKLADVMF